MKPVSNEAAEREADREALEAWCREERKYRELDAWDKWNSWGYETWEEREVSDEAD
jgi:hypothetical protein